MIYWIVCSIAPNIVLDYIHVSSMVIWLFIFAPSYDDYKFKVSMKVTIIWIKLKDGNSHMGSPMLCG
jgi:hypothetical protein